MSENTNTGGFDFAIAKLKAGHKVRRASWANSSAEVFGPGIFLSVNNPCATGRSTQRYVAINTQQLHSDNPEALKGCYPWTASQPDLLADDWVIVDC